MLPKQQNRFFLVSLTLALLGSLHQAVNAQNSPATFVEDFRAIAPTCNNAARTWIRALFHDCGTWSLLDRKSGGCDGSLQVGYRYVPSPCLSAQFELERAENRGLEKPVEFFRQIVASRNTTMADTIVFAGLFAIFQCRGPVIPFVPGRVDSLVANPVGRLPGPISTSEDTMNIFVKRMGFTPEETVAIIGGAHSVGRVHRVNVQNLAAKEGSMDSTITAIDNRFFRQLLAAPQLAKLPADANLLNDTQFRAPFVAFSQDQNNLFLPAFKAGIMKLAQFIPPAAVINATAPALTNVTTPPFTNATTPPVNSPSTPVNSTSTAEPSAITPSVNSTFLLTGGAPAGTPSNFSQPSAFTAPSAAPHLDPASSATNNSPAVGGGGSSKSLPGGSSDLAIPTSDASSGRSSLAALIGGLALGLLL